VIAEERSHHAHNHQPHDRQPPPQGQPGATAIEHGLIAAGIGIAIAATVTLIGTDLVTLFGKIQTALT